MHKLAGWERRTQRLTNHWMFDTYKQTNMQVGTEAQSKLTNKQTNSALYYAQNNRLGQTNIQINK